MTTVGGQGSLAPGTILNRDDLSALKSHLELLVVMDDHKNVVQVKVN
jgi:hypothetical protein